MQFTIAKCWYAILNHEQASSASLFFARSYLGPAGPLKFQNFLKSRKVTFFTIKNYMYFELRKNLGPKKIMRIGPIIWRDACLVNNIFVETGSKFILEKQSFPLIFIVRSFVRSFVNRLKMKFA